MDTRLRALVFVVCPGLLGVVPAGCLGQDYKRFDLELWDWHHGWMATVEPDEVFSVALWEHPAFPAATWTLVEHDPAHVALEGSSVDTPKAFPVTATGW